MKIRVFFIFFLLIKVCLARDEDYSFVKKLENGVLVPLAVNECPNLKDDPVVLEMIARRYKWNTNAISSTSASTSDRITSEKSDAATTGSPTSVASKTEIPTHEPTTNLKISTAAVTMTTEDDVTSKAYGSATPAHPLTPLPTFAVTFPQETTEDDVTSEASESRSPGDPTTPLPTFAVTSPGETTEGSCNITFNGTCYWTHIEDGLYLDVSRAEEICSTKASIPAYFPNEEVYNETVEEVRLKIPSGLSWIVLWTGVTIGKDTGKVSQPSDDVYLKWYPNNPKRSIAYKEFTHVAVAVQTDPNTRYQGMINYSPSLMRHGVICQKIIY